MDRTRIQTPDHHIVGQIHSFCKHLIRNVRKNIFQFSIHCFVLSICITNCNANDVLDHNINIKVSDDYQLSKYPRLLFRRDANQNSNRFECNRDEECNQNTIYTICRDNRCICNQGFTRSADNNTCIRTDMTVANDEHNQSKNELTTGREEEKKSDEKPKEKYNGTHMLPIMIVLGVMFIGMCVALNLFSRARFRESRGIFSKPHLIKFNNNSSTKSNNKNRRTSPPNPNNMIVDNMTLPDSDLPKNGSYVSIALES